MYSADLTAAFNLLHKEKLVEIMLRMGLPGYLFKIIHNYFSDRTGYVQIGNSRSCVLDIKTGCVQGSILGPVLFNLYTSELKSIVSPCSMVSYADDTYVIWEGETSGALCRQLSDTMNAHFEWLGMIGMKCNLEKTELIVFGHDRIEVDLKEFGVKIQSKDSMKILGILVDSNLKWESQVNKISARARSFVFSLRYLRKFLTLQEIENVFKAQIIPTFTYGAPSWSNHLSYQLRARLRSAYFFLLRAIIRDYNRRLNRSGMLGVMGLESIDTILFKRTSVFLFSLVYNLQPTNICFKLLSKCYHNDRTPDKLYFSDTSRGKKGKLCITNQAKNITEQWDFDWLTLSKESFKTKLREQCSSVLV